MMLRAIAICVSASAYAAVVLGGTASAQSALPSVSKTVSSTELSRAFGAPSGWRFTASQGPEIPDPLGEATDKAPGAIRLCLSRDSGRTCLPILDKLLAGPRREDLFSQPHFLSSVRIVHPRPDLPLLLIQVASLHSGDGDQRVATVALAYDPRRDSFVPAYEKQTGRNNNQEIRYVETSRLHGAIVSAEPTSNAPFGYWITVNLPGLGIRYHQALRYRSATIYADGNSLAVIDSEMPNLQQRLGLWHSGAKLPLPAGPCPRPRLINHELWCSGKPAA